MLNILAKIYFTLILLAATFGAANAQVSWNCANLPTFTGDGTYYGATGDGNCSFGASPNDLKVAALNNSQYGSADLCGACARVQGPKGTVDVRIVDRCPECQFGDLDFSLEAFTQIAEQAAGRVDISWRPIACPVTGNIEYRYKDGSSQWWCAVQIRNHRYPVAKLEYRKNDGTYVAMQRENYNYFLASSGIDEDKSHAGPYRFRVTDVFGQVVEDTNVLFTGGGAGAPGGSQFSVCESSERIDALSLGVRLAGNPVSENIILLLDDVRPITFSLRDLNGRIVWKERISGSNRAVLPAPTVSGLYLLEMEKGNARAWLKILVE